MVLGFAWTIYNLILDLTSYALSLRSSSSSSELKPQKWKKIAEEENFHFCGIDSQKKPVLNLNYAGVFLDSGKLHTTILLMF